VSDESVGSGFGAVQGLVNLKTCHESLRVEDLQLRVERSGLDFQDLDYGIQGSRFRLKDLML